MNAQAIINEIAGYKALYATEVAPHYKNGAKYLTYEIIRMGNQIKREIGYCEARLLRLTVAN